MIRYRQQGSVVLSTQDIASPLLAMTELKDRTAGASCVPSGAANPAGSRAQQRHPPCKTQLFHHSRNAATPWPPHLIHLVLSETELVHQHVVRRELRPHGL